MYLDHLHRPSDRSYQTTFPYHLIIILGPSSVVGRVYTWEFSIALLLEVACVGLAEDEWPAYPVNNKDVIILTGFSTQEANIGLRKKHFTLSSTWRPFLCTIRLSGVSQGFQKRSESSGRFIPGGRCEGRHEGRH